MLETLDAVLDVGGVYDPAKDRYDHHQKGFEEVFGHGFNTKLSSAGLVYKVIANVVISNSFFFALLCDEAVCTLFNRFFLIMFMVMNGYNSVNDFSLRLLTD